jgi:hypothetical protein
VNAYIQSKENNGIGKKMTHNISLDREAIAVAACDVAGLERPLDTYLPEEKRQYLYARPGDSGDKFSADSLAKKLKKCSVQCGVQWDPANEKFGLRFVAEGVALPVDIRAHTSSEAEDAWREWKSESKKMAEFVTDASVRISQGEDVHFSSEDIPVAGKKNRRKQGLGERD